MGKQDKPQRHNFSLERRRKINNSLVVPIMRGKESGSHDLCDEIFNKQANEYVC